MLLLSSELAFLNMLCAFSFNQNVHLTTSGQFWELSCMYVGRGWIYIAWDQAFVPTLALIRWVAMCTNPRQTLTSSLRSHTLTWLPNLSVSVRPPVSPSIYFYISFLCLEFCEDSSCISSKQTILVLIRNAMPLPDQNVISINRNKSRCRSNQSSVSTLRWADLILDIVLQAQRCVTAVTVNYNSYFFFCLK